MPYDKPLVWFGTWTTETGLVLNAFHVWGRDGAWRGAYGSCTRARAEAKLLD
jgi:hypothetical protein